MRQLIPSFIVEILAQMFSQLSYGKLRIKWGQIALCFLLPTILMACSTALTNVKPGQPLKPEEGILVIHFHPTYEGFLASDEIPFKIIFKEAEKTLPDKHIKITSPDYLKVITLPAGEYKWSSLHIYQHHWMFSEDSSFVVQAGKMIYLGDIYYHFKLWLFGIKGKIAVKDNNEDVLKLLNEEYPSMVRKYGLSKNLTTMKFK